MSELADQKIDISADAVETSQDTLPVSRPPINFSSAKGLSGSLWSRFRSVWTRQFTLSLLAGQAVSICITCTNVATTELVKRNWALPTTQSFFVYFFLFLVYTPYTIYQYGFKGWAKMVLKDGWRYFILAACDVEANFLVVKAYQYTDLLSCMLLNAWAIPTCLFFSWLLMRVRYHYSQIIGILICVGGLGMTVASDFLTEKSWQPTNRGLGDGLMIAGATLYGFTNATEEFFVRKRPLYEVVGQLGFWGFLICGTQAAALEHEGMRTASWNGGTSNTLSFFLFPIPYRWLMAIICAVGLLIAFTSAMLILYTIAPLLYRLASSAFYNISLLSANFYGLLFGLFLYQYKPFWLYFFSFAVVICGLVVYFWHETPEGQGIVDPQAPDYVSRRRGGYEVDHTSSSSREDEMGCTPALPREPQTVV